MAFFSRIVTSGFRIYWRATRSFALAAEACVIDEANRIALIKTGTENGWRLPRTNVRNGEAVDEALQRLLTENLQIRTESFPDLFWIYRESTSEPPGLTSLYVVRQWHRGGTSPPSGLSFFALGLLPAGLPAQDAARIRQAAEGRAPFEVC